MADSFYCAQLVVVLASVGLYFATAIAGLVAALRTSRESYRRTMWLIFAILAVIFVLNGTELATNLFGATIGREMGNVVDWAIQAQLVVEWALTAVLGVVFLSLRRFTRQELGSDVSA